MITSSNLDLLNRKDKLGVGDSQGNRMKKPTVTLNPPTDCILANYMIRHEMGTNWLILNTHRLKTNNGENAMTTPSSCTSSKIGLSYHHDLVSYPYFASSPRKK
jgi:hypothetical protein